MIAATVLAILLIFGVGGGPFGELTTKYVKDPIKETIAEEGRRDKALDELKSLKHAIKDFNKHVSKDIKQFDKMVKNYDSTPEEFDQMISGVFTKRNQDVEKLWQRRSAMLAHIQADEWQTIISRASAKAEEDKK
jgi:DNA anti-recombination protein RmuC